MSRTDDPWVVLSTRRIYENPWIAVEERDVLNPAGKPGIYGIVRFRKLAVGVLPIEADGTVHLVGQWRPPLARYSWEMPEGGAEPGEAAEDCARRELEEEAGVRAERLIEVLRIDISNSVTDEQAVCFIALGLKAGEKAPEETEVLGHRRVPFKEALAEALDGRIRDGLTVATLLRAHHMATIGAIEPNLARAMLGA